MGFEKLFNNICHKYIACIYEFPPQGQQHYLGKSANAYILRDLLKSCAKKSQRAIGNKYNQNNLFFEFYVAAWQFVLFLVRTQKELVPIIFFVSDYSPCLCFLNLYWFQSIPYIHTLPINISIYDISSVYCIQSY